MGLTAALVLACGGTVQAPRTVKSTRTIADDSKNAVVRIENDLGDQVGIGTGFVVREDGRIATNLHVIAGGGDVTVRLADGSSFPVERVIAIDENRDLAVVQIGADDLPVLPLGDSDQVSAGDRVVAIGNPLRLDYTVSDGLISSVRALEEDVILQISAPISQGSSGGPLFNVYGEVIGVATLVSSQGQNLNFGVPVNYLRPLVSREGGETLEEFSERFEAPERPRSQVETDTGTIVRTVPKHEVSVLDDCSDKQILEVFQGITRAIELGAPVYNKGDHEACFVIYQQTAQHFEKEPSMCRGVREALGAGLLAAESRDSFTGKAWAMRDAFDGLLDVMVRKARTLQPD